MDDRRIDDILNLFLTYDSVISEGSIRLKAGLPDNKLIDRALALGLIDNANTIAKRTRSFILTALGHEVVKHGGWRQYLEDKQEEKRLSTELIKLSIRTNRLQGRLLWFTVGLTAITLFVSILDYKTHREELRLEQNRLLRTEERGQHIDQKIKTVDPNRDSSANYAPDSLRKKSK